MNVIRAIVVFVISVSLPFSATAVTLTTLCCNYDRLGALKDAATSSPAPPCREHRSMEAHGDASTAKKAGDHCCDCAKKCCCQHHCSVGGGLAAMSMHQHLPSYTQVNALARAAAAFVTGAKVQGLFRPPIAAPPGAA